MWEVDLEKFWADDAKAHEENCFAKAEQTALGIRMSEECVFAELGEEGTPWAPIDPKRRVELNKRYNDKAEKIIGLRPLREALPNPDAQLPYVKRIGEVFGGSYTYHSDSEWLMQAVDDPDDLAKLLDRVEATDLRHFILPANWEEEKRRVYETYGVKPNFRAYRGIRGPVTLAASIYGPENLLFLWYDDPDLFRRFAQVIADVTLGIARVMDEEAGVSAETERGFAFNDDNCCLMTPEMYRNFGYPVLKKLFDTYSPDPGDSRYQHSDSAMGHIVPILGELNLTGCNFGPTVLVPEIRKSLPHCRIDGCIAPFSFMRNDTEALKRETLRDIADNFTCGGVNISTAGSINNGSSLESMRMIMSLIQQNRRS